MRTIASLGSLIIVTSSFLCPQASAQSITWSEVHGPYAGTVQALAVDMSGDVYTAAYDGREEIYASTDDGQSWHLVLSLLSYGYEPSLAVDSSNSVYYGDGTSGLYKSTDRGSTWQKTDLAGGASAISLISGGRLCVGGSKTLSISRDGGMTWSVSQVRADQGDVSTIVEDSAGDIYAGFHMYYGYYSTGGGIYMSSDSGKTWRLSGLPGDSVISMTAGTHGKVFASISSGSKWSIYSSTEGDTAWTRDAAGIPAGVTIATLSTDELGETTVLTDSGVFAYDNAASEWVKATPMVSPAASVTQGFYNPTGISYAGTSGDGLYHLVNAKTAWTQCGVVPATITALGKDNMGNLFAGTVNGIFEKQRDGTRWLRTGEVGSGSVYQLYPSPSERRLYACTAGGLFYLPEGGNYWVPLIREKMYSCVVVPNKYIIAGTPGGILEQNFATGLWGTPPSIGLPMTRIYCLALDSSNYVFAGTDYAGVFESTDGGTFWAESGVSSRLVFYGVKSLGIDNHNAVFAGTDSGGAFYSSDDGDTWSRISSITANEVNAFLVSRDSEYFAGTAGNGVFVSTDRGVSWFSGNNGLDNANVSCFLFDTFGNVYAGTDSGLFMSHGVITSVRQNEETPSVFTLEQNFPNPFNPSTVVTYRVSSAGRVTLKVYDVLGRLVATLVDRMTAPGTYSVRFDGSTLPSGLYFCRLTSVNKLRTIKMLLLK